MIRILDESDFDNEVLHVEGEILVELFATWCPHCQRMAPVVEELAEIEKGRLKIYRVDIDKSPNLANQFAPQGVPTFALFKDGEQTGSISGEQDIERLESFVQA